MKEPIEELFKQSLKGHEMPYNPDAWKAMSARLDAVSPVVAPTSYLKYYIGAAVIGVAAVTTYVILSSGNPTETASTQVAKETSTEKTSTVTNKPTTGNRETQTSNTSVISNPSETPTSSETGLQNTSIMKGNSDQTNNNSTGDLNASNDEHNGNNVTPNLGLPPHNNWELPVPPTPVKVIPRITMKMPTVTDLCMNEEATITNPNSQEIFILDGLNQIMKTIPAKKSVVFKPTQVGNYTVGYKTHSGLERGISFQVNRIPDADFMIDVVNKYENGLPSTHVEAISGQGTYIWKAEKQSASGLEADMHFYKKGDQTIQLIVNNGQCSASVEKTIYIENDYNLMAVNAITPESIDPKNKTFMPFALTQRNVNFTLTIIDSRDGGIVYQTSDASLPWDGTDIRTGRRGETPQVYVWKAVISNPAANEPNEYLGTITMN